MQYEKYICSKQLRCALYHLLESLLFRDYVLLPIMLLGICEHGSCTSQIQIQPHDFHLALCKPNKLTILFF